MCRMKLPTGAKGPALSANCSRLPTAAGRRANSDTSHGTTAKAMPRRQAEPPMVRANQSSQRPSIGRFLTTRPAEEDDCRSDQEVEAGPNPHDEASELLVVPR